MSVEGEELVLSDEHTGYRWCSFEQAQSLVRWDSNRTALWELEHRLLHGLARG
ncbi:hypothetical protein ACTD5D_22895 [Nocardia takedensis]|uniref:hypothetical protein n=1 Tax=Nocardia takedensis TaxID=259390 RepID=UPI003F759788